MDLKQKKLAIIVEDSRAISRATAAMLAQVGFETRIYDDGAAALEALTALSEEGQAAISLIVSDVEMPNLEGPDFIAKLRAYPVLAKVPFIFCSSATDPSLVLRTFKAKADGYIVKPMTREKLASCLGGVFGTSFTEIPSVV